MTGILLIYYSNSFSLINLVFQPVIRLKVCDVFDVITLVFYYYVKATYYYSNTSLV